MREKIKGVEHCVILGVVVVVIALVVWLWLRKKSDKPRLADVALERAAEKAHHRHDAALSVSATTSPADAGCTHRASAWAPEAGAQGESDYFFSTVTLFRRTGSVP